MIVSHARMRSETRLLEKVINRLKRSDPVAGRWVAGFWKGTIWCDASSLMVAYSLEIDGGIVEDGAWLRKEDVSHITHIS